MVARSSGHIRPVHTTSMSNDTHTRQQLLRKQAELRSLYANLGRLRNRETSFIDSAAVIPALFQNQILKVRLDIKAVEDDLLDLDESRVTTPARELYWEAFTAEELEDWDKALKLYRQAARQGHPDANDAIRNIRYRIKVARTPAPVTVMGLNNAIGSTRVRLIVGIIAAILLVFIMITLLNLRNRWPRLTMAAITPTATATPLIILVVTPTPTAVLTSVNHPPSPTMTPSPTVLTPVSYPPSPEPTATKIRPTNTPTLKSIIISTDTPIPSSTPIRQAAPQIIDPQNGHVWHSGAGAIIFEFEPLDLAPDEVYCLDTLRGFDHTLTESWSFEAISSEDPSIVIEGSVFEIAQSQGIQCILWSAAIGQESCETLKSEKTEVRVIGLPNPCKFE